MQTRQGRGCVALHSVGIVFCLHWLNNQLSSIPYFCGRKSIIKVDRYMLLLLLLQSLTGVVVLRWSRT
jgi:hypothetical protein